MCEGCGIVDCSQYRRMRVSATIASAVGLRQIRLVPESSPWASAAVAEWILRGIWLPLLSLSAFVHSEHKGW